MKPDYIGHNEVAGLRRSWSTEETQAYIRKLSIWEGEIRIEQKFGGLQNRTYFITDADGSRFAVRCGFDQYRTRQTAVVQCTIGAHKLGLGPSLRYWEPSLTVTDFIENPKMTAEVLKEPKMMAHTLERLKMLHEGSDAVEQSMSYWWPFHTVRRYLNEMEAGKPETGNQPSKWIDEVPLFRRVTDTLEQVIRPYIPVFTHNDTAYVNMIFNDDGEVMFIDWDGGGFGNRKWDIAEMLMWLESDEEMDRYALGCYFGKVDDDELGRLLQENLALKVMAALRLITEIMETDLDPYYYLSPEEMAISMQEFFPGQEAKLNGLADLLRPGFETYWAQYEKTYG